MSVHPTLCHTAFFKSPSAAGESAPASKVPQMVAAAAAPPANTVVSKAFPTPPVAIQLFGDGGVDHVGEAAGLDQRYRF